MSPGFQMLILWALMQIARSARMGIQLVRLRALEREIERKLIEHTARHDPGGAIMIEPTLAVQIHLEQPDGRWRTIGEIDVSSPDTNLGRR